jgi:hypothetical protein
MNNKAQFVDPVMILIAFTVCGAAFYYASSFSSITAEAISINKTVGMFNEQEQLSFYLKDYADIALQGAYAETAKSPVICAEQIGTIAVWSDKCRPNNQDAKNLLKAKFAEKLSASGKQFNSEIKEKLNVKFSPIVSNISEKNKMIEYNLSNTLNVEISLDYPKIDFEEIYLAAASKKSECKSRFASNTEADKDVKIARCIEEMGLDNWSSRVTFTGNYYLFTLNSKKLYLYENSLKSAALQFALEK